jgi:hypothetical protein
MYRKNPAANILVAGLLTLTLLSCAEKSPKESQPNASANVPKPATQIAATTSVDYKGFRIEIVALNRVQKLPSRSRPVKIKPPERPARLIGDAGIPRVLLPGSEIAVVRLRTTNDNTPGARFSGVVLYDSAGNEYKSPVINFGIGVRGEKVFFPQGVLDYDFPFVVPQGSNLTVLQLRNDEDIISFDLKSLSANKAVSK